MSAVLDGPVMKLMTAPDMLRAGSAWSASSMVPTCSSDSRRQARSKTATWVAGKREDERGRLGESPVHAGDADLRAPRGIPVKLPRRNVRIPIRSEGDRVSLGAEACPQVESERSWVPRQHALRLSRLGNMLDHPGHLVQSRHAVEDSPDTLELLAEALEGPRPSLGHLPLDHLEGLARVER